MIDEVLLYERFAGEDDELGIIIKKRENLLSWLSVDHGSKINKYSIGIF